MNLLRKYFQLIEFLLKNRILFLLLNIFIVGTFLFFFVLLNNSSDENNKALAIPTAFEPFVNKIKAGTEIYVSPFGNDENDGFSSKMPIKTIQKAVNSAQAGDTIYLLEGDYFQDIVTVRNGEKNKPITITGSSSAIVKGGGNTRVFEVNHSYIVLKGFTIDGHYNNSEEISAYRDKLLYVVGREPKKGVTGLKVLNMKIRNAGGECIRIKYFAQNNEVANNNIQNCGIYDFKFKDGGKNGEGIYIGTAPEQTDDGKNPTMDIDESNNNWIHNNKFDTQGNECVDIKEGSKENIVEYNFCTGQKDDESAGMDSRGNNNTFRFNEIFGNIGAGVRLGGDKKSDGINNDVYENKIRDNQGGGIKFQRMPQGKICGNTMNNNGKNVTGSFGSKFEPNSFCK